MTSSDDSKSQLVVVQYRYKKIKKKVESNLHASAQNVIMLLRPAWQIRIALQFNRFRAVTQIVFGAIQPYLFFLHAAPRASNLPQLLKLWKMLSLSPSLCTFKSRLQKAGTVSSSF